MTRTSRIRQVWASNLEQEINRLAQLSDVYTHVAMHTEFPGVVFRPIGDESKIPYAFYHAHRFNVDLLKMIQLGLSVSTEDGQRPEECDAWQFNFAFNINNDMYAQDSIDYLTSNGMDFAEHEQNGIDAMLFGELITSSGLVLNPDITWISFSGGYDFCYLIKVLTAIPLPEEESEFFEYVSLFFPRLYDLKYLMASSDKLGGGLDKVAKTLGCERADHHHPRHSGSNASLILDIYFRMKEEMFQGGLVDPSKCGVLYSLEMSLSSNGDQVSPLASPSHARIKEGNNAGTGNSDAEHTVATPP